MSEWQPLGQILQEQFAVAAEQVDTALAEQQDKAARLGEILCARGVIDEGTLARALALQQGLDFCPSPQSQGSVEDLLRLIPIAFAKERHFFPLERGEHGLRVAVADPLDSELYNDLVALTGERPEFCVATGEEILRAINRGYEKQAGTADGVIEEIEDHPGAGGAPSLEPDDLLDAADEAPIIRFVNSLITQGYKERASDIHIEPFERDLIVRYRIDGVLYEVLRPPLKAHSGIVSRIKILAHLNIAEKRLPQDGRFRVRVAGRDLDIRVSALPTAHGERIVLRLLDKTSSLLSLEEIGLNDDLLRQVRGMISKSYGVFLVTGPTGSGKTTTLYSVLSQLNQREKNIITVEDPIEYQLAGVGQIQVNNKIDLTFANGLRSILRQDPDVIMVGEIRDRETAEIVVQSALTGHMVFSTLHTNDAAGALTRLVEMDVEPFLAASGIVGVLAQRLVRQICPHCRESYQPSEQLLNELGDVELPPEPRFYRGRGCERCLQIGYWGRQGIYELLPMEESIRELLLANKDAATIRNAAVARGMRTLRQAGVEQALRGTTSLEEVLRVTQEEI